MAFKGGFLLKPTETGVSSLANLYLQGKQAIDKKQREFDAKAQEGVDKLTEASSFAVTGINQYDNLMSGFGNNLRQRAMILKDLYDQRKISLSQLNAGLNSMTSDAKIGSQYATVSKERLGEIRKGVDEGELSELNLELGGFFKSKNAGKEPLVSNYGLNYIGNNLSIVRDYQYRDKDGKIQQDQESVALSVVIDPDRPLYKKVNLDDDIKTFIDTIGKQTTINNYEKAQVLEDGTIRYASITDPTQLDDVKKAVEQRIDSYSDRDLISIAHDELGFQSTSFSDFDFNSLKKRAYRKRGTFLDENNSTMEFEAEDFIIGRNPETGDFVLEENQKDLVRSYLRGKHLGAFDIIEKEKFVTPEEEKSVGKFYAGSATVDSLSDIVSDMGSKYGELIFGNAAMSLEDMDTEEAEKLRGISSAIYEVKQNKAVSSVSSINTPAGLNEKLAKALPINSFTGQKISSINQIVSIMRDGKIDFIVTGPSTLARISRESETGSGVDVTTSVNFEEAPSEFLSENTVKRMYTELLDNEDFKMTASQLGLKESYATYDEYAEALNSIIQDYATAE